MEIQRLNKDLFAGKEFTVKYITNGYYDVIPSEIGFEIRYLSFEKPIEKSFVDTFFGEWLEKPIAYGAFEDGNLIGFVEGSIESWNNRFRISNICVFDETKRRCGIGNELMRKILSEANFYKPRMIVLETQTCNEKAIAFYRKNGFSIIGFDLYSYSNADPAKHEIRIEMGLKTDIN